MAIMITFMVILGFCGYVLYIINKQEKQKKQGLSK